MGKREPASSSSVDDEPGPPKKKAREESLPGPNTVSDLIGKPRPKHQTLRCQFEERWENCPTQIKDRYWRTSPWFNGVFHRVKVREEMESTESKSSSGSDETMDRDIEDVRPHPRDFDDRLSPLPDDPFQDRIASGALDSGPEPGDLELLCVCDSPGWDCKCGALKMLKTMEQRKFRSSQDIQMEPIFRLYKGLRVERKKELRIEGRMRAAKQAQRELKDVVQRKEIMQMSNSSKMPRLGFNVHRNIEFRMYSSRDLRIRKPGPRDFQPVIQFEKKDRKYGARLELLNERKRKMHAYIFFSAFERAIDLGNVRIPKRETTELRRSPVPGPQRANNPEEKDILIRFISCDYIEISAPKSVVFKDISGLSSDVPETLVFACINVDSEPGRRMVNLER